MSARTSIVKQQLRALAEGSDRATPQDAKVCMLHAIAAAAAAPNAFRLVVGSDTDIKHRTAVEQGVNQGKISKQKRQGKRNRTRAQGGNKGTVAADAAMIRQRSLQYYLATARSDARVEELMRQV